MQDFHDFDIYIHIGFHRTGTTFLQEKIFPFLVTTNYIPQYEIIDILTDITTTDPYLWDKLNYQNKIYAALSKFLQKDKKNILSAECLVGFPFTKGINRTIIINRLKSLFPSAKLIVGFREQCSMLTSVYSLYIREGGTLKFSSLINKYNNRSFGYLIYDNLIETIDLDYYKYSLFFMQIKELFSEENIYFFLMEEFIERPGKSIQKLCQFIEADWNEQSIERLNKGYSPGSMNSIRTVNKLTRGFKNDSLIKNLQKAYFNKLLNYWSLRAGGMMNSDIQLFIKNYYTEDNFKLAETLPAYATYIKNFNKNER